VRDVAALDELIHTTDWSRAAVPQPDGHDTRILLEFREHEDLPQRPFPHRYRAFNGAATLCDGRVTIQSPSDHGLMPSNLLPASLDHPNLAAAANLLARWPEAYTQFTQLVDTVYPYTDPQQAVLGQWALGSSSNSSSDEPGSVHVTVDSVLGLAQALVQEMAHQKLRSLGVAASGANRLIVNDSSEQFESPVRKDRLLPMTAVFHLQYSFMHVTALDLQMLVRAESEWERQCILMLLARNIPRMQAGCEVISSQIRTDAAGKPFLEAFMNWSRGILQSSQAELDANGYGFT
jgi:HEXXH motif-containing protein